MSDRGAADQDLFQIWLSSSRRFLDAGLGSGSMTGDLRDKCAGLFTTWNRFAQAYAQASGVVPGEATGGPFDPVGWIDAAGGGGYGDLWHWLGNAGENAGRDALTGTREWQAYSAALERYRTVMGAAWSRAFKNFAEEMTADRDRGENAPGWEEMQTTWQRAASAEMAIAQRSDDFLDAQRELIRARLDCTARLRGQIERIAGLLGLPTRAELDDLHQNVHDLKREIRKLRGQAGKHPRGKT
jgi:poly[(R)-3-hydroxyalkanoate] polymerase subunit PhaE